MTFRLGLTGSIGMGKSTTAQLFAEEGCAVWDADAAVHRLYAPDGLAVGPVGERFPEVIEDGAVSRAALKRVIEKDPEALKQLEAIVHPLVVKDRETFVARTTADIVVLDIPLLFETNADRDMDAVACVTVDAETQRKRVTDRPGMDDARFEAMRDRQMPDAEKQARADYVIETDTIEHARAQVQAVIADIRKRCADA
ncbi:dephospho-CoA kinase [Roseovarius salinarum]|uniref:dephospho-CoA kinase n=1 Tax=Roseovarius salinarum TaxID=1981892 RepID=UPI000C3482EF|nr:dephospho-CoA kinase [Roseovarius salinarum]